MNHLQSINYAQQVVFMCSTILFSYTWVRLELGLEHGDNELEHRISAPSSDALDLNACLPFIESGYDFVASTQAVWCTRCYWTVFSGTSQHDGQNKRASAKVRSNPRNLYNTLHLCFWGISVNVLCGTRLYLLTFTVLHFCIQNFLKNIVPEANTTLTL